MYVRRILTIGALALLLTGCVGLGGVNPEGGDTNRAPAAGPGDVAAPAQPEDESPPPSQSGSNTDSSGNGSTEAVVEPVQAGKLPITHTTTPLHCSYMAPGVTIDQVGTYYLDAATGEVKGCRFTNGGEAATTPVGDRWLLIRDQNTVSLSGRESDAAYQWAQDQVRLLTWDPGHFLFGWVADQKLTGQFTLTDAHLQPGPSFHVALNAEGEVQAIFSGDGKVLALNPYRWRKPTAESGVFTLVDTATGAITTAGVPPEVTEGQVLGATLTASPDGPEFAVRWDVQLMQPTGIPESQMVLQRYDWSGQKLFEAQAVGNTVQYSPDGEHLSQTLGGFAPATLVLDLATGQPLFRVMGMSPAGWVGGGSTLLLDGPPGYRLLTPAGELQETPLAEVAPRGTPLLPSPTDPDLFAVGGWRRQQIVDGTGNVVHQVALAENLLSWWPPSWTPTGQALRFSVTGPVGKDGWYGDFFNLPPVVQRPPGDDTWLLQVQDPKGECLNLRTDHTITGEVIRCLPTGTRLAVADLSSWREKLNSPVAGGHAGGDNWLYVRTAEGETGWVALFAGSLTWVAGDS